jgi:hypothetical protein
MATTEFVIEQQTGSQWVPIAEGEFTTLEDAEKAKAELENKLNWTNLRIVECGTL